MNQPSSARNAVLVLKAVGYADTCNGMRTVLSFQLNGVSGSLFLVFDGGDRGVGWEWRDDGDSRTGGAHRASDLTRIFYTNVRQHTKCPM